MAKTFFTPVGNCAGSRGRPLLVFDEAAGDPVELALRWQARGSGSCPPRPHQLPIPPTSRPQPLG
jgi:hypothetical protein